MRGLRRKLTPERSDAEPICRRWIVGAISVDPGLGLLAKNGAVCDVD